MTTQLTPQLPPKKQTPRTQAKALLANGVVLSYLHWCDDPAKPVALLIHGTGFVAATFEALAQRLTPYFQVYAYDRRGHGDSSKPDTGYGFANFSEDCIQFAATLDIKNIYGIGHSAGGTDMLLAAGVEKTLFQKLFLLEPTIVDSGADAEAITPTEDQPSIPAILEKMAQRRSVFDSKQVVFERYKTRETFMHWDPLMLQEYINEGFKSAADGRIELQCTPQLESAILDPILHAFDNITQSANDELLFKNLPAISIPIALSASGLSPPIYHQMVARAERLLPSVSMVIFKDNGHCIAQENAVDLAREIIKHWG